MPAGRYQGQMVVYDTLAPEGIVWDRVFVQAWASPNCEAT